MNVNYVIDKENYVNYYDPMNYNHINVPNNFSSDINSYEFNYYIENYNNIPPQDYHHQHQHQYSQESYNKNLEFKQTNPVISLGWTDFFKTERFNPTTPNDQMLKLIQLYRHDMCDVQELSSLLSKECPGLETMTNMLTITLEGLDSGVYLDQEDLESLLTVFGKTKDVKVTSANSARIEAQDYLQAWIIRQQLNSKFIKDLNVYISVEFDTAHFSTYLNYPTSLADNIPNPDEPEEPEEPSYSEIHKYVCKYELLVDKMPDYRKDFSIAKRIIGSRGANMREIVHNCTSMEKSSNLEAKYNYKPKKEGDRDKEAVKLRLRGRGSGYKENNKKEISESLHLCVSSKYEETYDYACSQIETILNKIKNEYRHYAIERKLQYEHLLWRKVELSQVALASNSSNHSNHPLSSYDSNSKSENASISTRAKSTRTQEDSANSYNTTHNFSDFYIGSDMHCSNSKSNNLEKSSNKDFENNQVSKEKHYLNQEARLSAKEYELKSNVKKISFSGERVSYQTETDCSTNLADKMLPEINKEYIDYDLCIEEKKISNKNSEKSSSNDDSKVDSLLNQFSDTYDHLIEENCNSGSKVSEKIKNSYFFVNINENQDIYLNESFNKTDNNY